MKMTALKDITLTGAPDDMMLYLYLQEGSQKAVLLVNGTELPARSQGHFLCVPVSGTAAVALSFTLEARRTAALGALTQQGTTVFQQGDLILGSGPEGLCFLRDRMYQVPEEPSALTL